MKKGIKVWSANARRKLRRIWNRVTWRFRRIRFPDLREIKVPTYKIANSPEIRISEIKARRFYIIDRAQIRAKSIRQKSEDVGIFEALSGFYSRPSIFHQLPYERYHTEENVRNDEDIFQIINGATV